MNGKSKRKIKRLGIIQTGQIWTMSRDYPHADRRPWRTGDKFVIEGPAHGVSGYSEYWIISYWGDREVMLSVDIILSARLVTDEISHSP